MMAASKVYRVCEQTLLAGAVRMMDKFLQKRVVFVPHLDKQVRLTGLHNYDNTCWLNALTQLTQILGIRLFDEHFGNRGLFTRKTIDWVSDQTGIKDLKSGAPPLVVVYKLWQHGHLDVGTMEKPRPITLWSGPKVCLSDMWACVSAKPGHAVFYLLTDEGWICIDDKKIYYETPEPDDVLVFAPYDFESLGKDPPRLHQRYEKAFKKLSGAGTSTPTTGNQNMSGNSGSIVQNFYMQQYQNSIDADLGDNVISPEGQGSNTSSSTSSSQSSGLGGWFSSLLNLGTKLLADKKTEETTNIEDRIETTVVGVTIINSQGSVGTTYCYSKPDSKAPSTVSDPVTRLGPTLSRHYTFKVGEWPHSQSHGHAWICPLPGDKLKKMGSFHEVVKAHHLVKNGWDVVVQVNASFAHSGALCVAAVPEYEHTHEKALKWSELEEPAYTYQQLSVFPHQLLNLRTNSSVHLVMPYIGPGPTTNLTLHNPWTIVILILSELTGPGQTVPVTMSVAPIDAMVNGPLPNPEAPIRVVSVPESDSFMSSVPDNSTPLYPKVVVPPRQVPGRFTNFIDVAKQTYSFCSISGKPYFEVTNTSGDEPLFQMDVSLSAAELHGTYVASLSSFFAQYRGSLNFNFIFTGAAATKAKFLVAFVPPHTAAPKTRDEAMACIHAVWDVGLNSAFSFNVPYSSPADFMAVYSAEATVVNVSGWLQVYALTALTSTDIAVNSKGRVLVAVSAGPDFSLRHPVDLPDKQVTNVGEDGEPGETEPRYALSPVDMHVHTDVSFLLDRFFDVETIELSNLTGSPTTHILNPFGSTAQLAWARLLNTCTYFFSNLELSIQFKFTTMPSSVEKGFVWVKWFPVGAPTKTTDAWQLEGGGNSVRIQKLAVAGLSPTVIFKIAGSRSQACGFNVPYTSMWRVVPVFYNGWGAPTKEKATYNWLPGAHFGSILLTSDAHDKGGCYLRYRFPRASMYCPRPIPPAFTRPADKTRHKFPTNINKQCTNYALLKLAGDVESNPGPTIFSKASADLNALSTSLGELTGMLKDLKAKAETYSPFYKMAKMLFKLATLAVAAMRTKDPVVVVMLIADFGLEVFDTGFFFSYFQEKLQPYMKTIPGKVSDLVTDAATAAAQIPKGVYSFVSSFFETPEGVVEKQVSLRTINDIFTLLKNSDWFIKTLVALKKWLVSWFKQEQQADDALYSELEKYPLYKLKLKEPDTQEEARQWFKDMQQRALAVKDKGLFSLLQIPLVNLPTSRPEPVVCVLRGASGQGKSYLANMMAQAISLLLTGKQNSVWSCPPDPTYFDGYNGQAVVIMDDLGQNPNGADFKYFCQMVSTTAFVPPMAHLDDKGIPFTSPVVICTTNLHSSFTPITVSCPEALKRRFRFDVTVSAKPGFVRTVGSSQLLNLPLALKPAGLPPHPIFENDMPILNGQAVKLALSGVEVTAFELIEMILSEVQNRQDTHKMPIFKQSWSDLFKKCTSDEEQKMLQFLIDHKDSEILKAFVSERSIMLHEEYMKWESYMTRRAKYHRLAADFAMFLSILTSLIVIFCLVYSMYQLFKTPDEHSAYDPATKPKPKTQEIKTLKIRTETGVPATDLQQSVMKNVQPIELYCEGNLVTDCSALGVYDNSYLVPLHLFEFDFDTIVLGGRQYSKADCEKVEFELSVGGDMVSSDACLLRLPSGPKVRNILHLFTNEIELKKMTQITGIMNSPHQARTVFFGSFLTVKKSILTSDGTVMPNVLSYAAQTSRGYCGAAIVAGSPARIIGIHSAGTGSVAFCSLVSRDALERTLPQKQGNVVRLDDDVRVSVPRRTKLVKSLAYPIFKPDFGPAPLSQFDKRLADGVKLDEVVFAKHTGDKEISAPDQKWLLRAAHVYAQKVFSRIGFDNQALTEEEAICGIPGLDKMEQDTAPGLPYAQQNKRRKDICDFEKGQLKGAAKLQKERFLKGDYSDLVYQSFLKDEIRPLEKVRAGKTRLIDVPPMPHVVVGRQLLGRFVSKFHEANGFEIGSAIGCDPDVDWTRFGLELERYRYVYACDYSRFDANHAADAMRVVLNYFFSEDHGFDPGVPAFIESLIDSVHAYEEKRYNIYGGLPSGCSCTSILNTVLNNVYILAAMMKAFENFEPDDILVLCYGDDCLIASDLEIDFQKLVPVFADFGQVITTADKTDFFKLTTLSEVTFLKRAFVPDGALYKPVMDVKTLEAILSFVRPGTQAEKLLSVAQLAGHCEPDEYEHLFQPFEGMYYVPTWRDLRLQWLMKLGC
uniref:Genome polyprotein n=2 Tax=Equine rhinitis A virus TaxID=47000 RepID=K9MZ26_9PICO|nr:polyprotein [Equine rhinitis A virus]